MLIKYISILIVLTAVAEAQSIGGRILNGENATDVVPYHVQLAVSVAGQPERGGSGVVLTPRLVITAATNIVGYNTFRAGFGSTSRADLQWVTAIIAQTIASFNPVTYENNIGFIIFDLNALASPFVAPISIPPPSLQPDLPFENEQGQIVGFGWTENQGGVLADNLQVAFNRVVSREECSNLYGVNQDTHFCTADNVTSTKVCAGDQGAAFVTSISGQRYLTGIASFILDYTCTPGVPALFVRTTSYRAYIDSNVSLWW